MISTIYVAILWLYLPILASLWLDVDLTEGLMGCLRSILWLCVKGPMDCLTSLASILWPYVCSVASEVAERAMGSLTSLASSLWPYVCSVASEVVERVGLDKEEATNVLNHLQVKGPMGCLTSLASAASEVAERAGLDKEEATNVCMDAKNCRAAWAVVAILGLFIYCQFCWQRVRRMRRKRSPKKQILTTRPDHIQGSTLHKPPSKHGSWTNYWKAVTCNKVLPERCPCSRLILREGNGHGADRAVGAHVIFQDRMGNYYGGIVPVSNTANRSAHRIEYECDIVTVLNFGQMTFEGKLMTNKKESRLIPRETSHDRISYKKERQFNSIKRVRSGEGQSRIIVEGFVGGFVNRKRIESTYIHLGAANKYIYYLAQAHVQQNRRIELPVARTRTKDI